MGMSGKSRIKLCIFDLDGTLIDSAPDLLVSANYTLAQFGLPPRTLEQIQASMGKGVGNLLKTSIPPEDLTDQLFEDVKAMYMDHYASHCTDNTIVYDGVYDMLRELQGQDISMAIVTNKPGIYLEKILADLFGDIKFCRAIGQGEYPHKPDPTAVFDIMKDLGVTRDQCVYAGDSDVDIQTGINAGVLTVGVSWGYRSVEHLKEAGAEHIIDTASQLLDMIENLGIR
jgi:phosphoglycolate phosphatase